MKFYSKILKKPKSCIILLYVFFTMVISNYCNVSIWTDRPWKRCRLRSRPFSLHYLPFDLHLLDTFEPRHDKFNKMSVRPAKTQISLGIHPVWSESSLCAHWIAKDPSFLHADSESDWADAQTDLSLPWVHNHIVGFVMRRLISLWQNHIVQLLG